MITGTKAFCFLIIICFCVCACHTHIFFQLSVFTCLVPDDSPLSLVVKIDPFDPHSTFERWVVVTRVDIFQSSRSRYDALSLAGCVTFHLPLALSRQTNVTLPQETRDNGSLYAVVYVHRAGVSPLEDNREVHYAAQLTTYATPVSAGRLGGAAVHKV